MKEPPLRLWMSVHVDGSPRFAGVLPFVVVALTMWFGRNEFRRR